MALSPPEVLGLAWAQTRQPDVQSVILQWPENVVPLS